MRWEYKIVYVGSDMTDEEEYERRLHESVQTLNSLGDDGWELVGYLPHRLSADLNKYHAVLKRELSNRAR